MLIGVTILFRVKHTLSRNLASQADLSKVLPKSSALQEGARKHVVHRLQEGARKHVVHRIAYRKGTVPGNSSLTLA